MARKRKRGSASPGASDPGAASGPARASTPEERAGARPLRRYGPWHALAAAVLALGAVSFARLARRAQPPNLLLVTIDTLRADRVGAYGADQAIANTVNMNNNVSQGFIGDYNLTFSTGMNILMAANNNTMNNNIVAGKALILGSGSVAATANVLTANRTLTIDGSGTTIFNGDFTTSTAFGVAITKTGSGSQSFSMTYTGAVGDLVSLTATQLVSGTPYQTSELALTATATATALVSEPPRPRVETRLRSGSMPWKPVITATSPCSKRARTLSPGMSLMRATPCASLVMMGICQPCQERALMPIDCSTIASRPAVTCSPVATTASYSRASCSGEASRTHATS